VVATLQKSISAGKIAHAYLFSGPRGCGKTTSARILARALNCEKGPTATPCGTCSSCIEIAKGSSLDVIEIDGASNTSVNDVRQIKDEVQFPPNSCRYKVYIIDEVHMLSTSAFNALLKTIEEPPPYVIFVFATTELHKVPATIKSRCQQFNVRLVPVEQLRNVLAEAASESGIAADDEALFWIAREATGSVRDAYTLFDQVAAFSDGHITFEKIRDKLGLLGVDRINPLVEACADKRAQDALSTLDLILQSGVSVEQFTVDLADFFRSLLLIKCGISKDSLLGQSVDRFSARVLEAWSSVQIERALGIMLQLFRDIRFSLDPRYELELAVSRLSWITDYVSSAEMKAAIVQARGLLLKESLQEPSQGTAQTLAKQTGTPVATQGDGGPFSDADRFGTGSGAVRAEVDENKNRNNGDIVSGDDAEARIENPFAAFKERLNGKAFAAATPSSVPAEPLPDSSVMPEPDAVHSDDSASFEADPDELLLTQADTHNTSAAISFADLPEALVSCFQSSKNMIATGLSQAFDWKEAESVIHFTVDKPFMHNFLEQDHKAIAEAVSRLLGRPSVIEIHLEAPPANAVSGTQAVPPEIEMVRRMFRGTIAGGK